MKYLSFIFINLRCQERGKKASQKISEQKLHLIQLVENWPMNNYELISFLSAWPGFSQLLNEFSETYILSLCGVCVWFWCMCASVYGMCFAARTVYEFMIAYAWIY